MKLHLLLPITALLLANACTKTRENAGTGHEEHDGHAEEVVFAPGKGLGLGEEARQAIGLESLEVSQQAIDTTATHQAQVFREAGERGVQGLYQTGSAYATCPLPESEAAGLAPGHPVAVLRDRKPYTTGSLVRLDRQMASLNGQVEVLVALADPEGLLKIGDSLDLAFAGEKREEALLIPETSVLKTAKGDFVYVKNGEFYLRTSVQTVPGREGWLAVQDGLFEGDTVVSQGAQGLYLAELQAVNGGTGCTHGH